MGAGREAGVFFSGMAYYGFDLSPSAMQTLRPLIKQAADDEWMDPDLKLELENLVCELTARLQHKGVYDLPD